MRKLLWGQYPAQQADFFARMGAGRSIIIDKNSLNAIDSAASDPDKLDVRNPQTVTDSIFRSFVKIALLKVRASVGHSPMVVRARLVLYDDSNQSQDESAAAWTPALFRILTARLPDWADCNTRYRDISASLGWGDDASIWAPVPGQDHHPVPFATITIPTTATMAAAWWYFDVTNELKEKLASGEDLTFMLCKTPIGTFNGGSYYTRMLFHWKDDAGHYPYLELSYMMPIEFFAGKPDNSIDLQKILDNSLDLDIGNLLLGSVERGETGSPVPVFCKNLGGRILKHFEVEDDSPEWSTPVNDAGNTGSAVLGYVGLDNNSVSQEYTIKFTSATAFQVLALAYKENSSSLNPTYGTTGWDGVIGSDWTAPSGGLTIPAAAWSGTPVANDKIYVNVTGQSTPSSWAADSGLQVEMAKDSAGSPDAATWRPVRGQRTYLASGVTIDNTSKTLTVRRITPADWPAGTKGFVADGTNIDEFTVVSATTTSVSVTFPSATGHAYSTGAKVCTTLPFRDTGLSVSAKSTAAAGVNETNPALIPLTNAATIGFTAASKVVIQSIDDPAVQEEITALSVDNVKITASAYLVNEYPSGSMVVQAGSGEVRFWLRIVSLPSTMEQLKRLRLTVRT